MCKNEYSQDRAERALQLLRRIRADEYALFVLDRRTLIRRALLAGFMRGLGGILAVVFAGTVGVMVLGRLLEFRLPYLNDFLHKVLKILNAHVGT